MKPMRLLVPPGVKVVVKVVSASGARVSGKARPETAKSALGPGNEIPFTIRSAVPVLRRVKSCGAEGMPTP